MSGATGSADQATALAAALDAAILAERGEVGTLAALDPDLAWLATLAEGARTIGADPHAAAPAGPQVRRRLQDAMRESRVRSASRLRVSRRGWRGALRTRLVVPALVLLLMVPVLALGQTNTGAGRTLRSVAVSVGVLPPWQRHARAADVRRARAIRRQRAAPPPHRVPPRVQAEIRAAVDAPPLRRPSRATNGRPRPEHRRPRRAAPAQQQSGASPIPRATGAQNPSADPSQNQNLIPNQNQAPNANPNTAQASAPPPTSSSQASTPPPPPPPVDPHSSGQPRNAVPESGIQSGNDGAQAPPPTND